MHSTPYLPIWSRAWGVDLAADPVVTPQSAAWLCPLASFAPCTNWRAWELEALAVLPGQIARAALVAEWRRTLVFRAGLPLRPAPTAKELQQVQRVRFGLLGEELSGRTVEQLRDLLRQEVKVALWTLEGEGLRLVRNWKLALHRARLRQLVGALTQRGVDVLRELRAALALLWK